MKTRMGAVLGSRVSVAITCVIVTAVVVAGGLAFALPGTRTVEADDLQTEAVNSRVIKNRSIARWDLRDQAVTSRVIKNRTIAPWDLRDAAIGTRQLRDESVTADKVAADAVTAATIANDAVRSRHLRRGVVTTSKLAADAVTGAKIADGTITSADLATGVIPQLLWAKVDANGAGIGQPTVVAGTPGTTASRFAAGHYEVTFSRSVSSCGWIATRNDVSEFRVDPGGIGVERTPGNADPNSVHVRTWNSADTLADLAQSDGFTLQVLC